MNAPAAKIKPVNQPLLFEMMRSFTTLARTLNLSHAVTELNSTRQTVRRHISQLEEIRGARLFDVVNRRYELTEEGKAALPAAQNLLGQGQLWLQGQLVDVEGLMGMSHEEPTGWYYHQQQQPISVAWKSSSALFRAAIRQWSLANGALETDAMRPIRPYALVYRDTIAGWICTEVGESSFYSEWYGWAEARSSVGRSLDRFPFGPNLARVMDVPLREVQRTRGMRIDQVVTRNRRNPDGPMENLVFERLLLGCHLPDDSFALLVLVDRPDAIRVASVDPGILATMPEDARVKFSEN
ncbi:MAG: LysR family transcriptional regulator [Tateyamaria sp.]